MGNSDKQELKSIEYNNLRLDLSRYELVVKDEIIKTPPKELELLFSWLPIRMWFLHAISYWMKYGDLNTMETHEP